MSAYTGGFLKRKPLFIARLIVRAILVVALLATIVFAFNLMGSQASAQQVPKSSNQTTPVAAVTASVPVYRMPYQMYRAQILGLRIQHLLNDRLKGLESCSVEERETLSGRFRVLSGKPEGESDTIALLELYLQSYKVSPACLKSLNEAEHALAERERKPFTYLETSVKAFCAAGFVTPGALEAPKCLQAAKQLIADLDPKFVEDRRANLDGQVLKRPFYAGYKMNMNDIEDLETGHPWSIRMYIDAVRVAIGAVESAVTGATAGSSAHPAGAAMSSSTVRLDEVFASTYNRADYRKLVLSVYTIASGDSDSVWGHVSSYGEEVWKKTLFKTESGARALATYARFKDQIEELTNMVLGAQSRGVNFVIGDESIRGKKDHDFVSAYLACTYRNNGEIMFRAFPEFLGYGYESIDYVSHRHSGMSAEAARQNFKEDTGRYAHGAKWGYSYCTSGVRF